jgi:hypothetical protein
MEPIELTV